jgi:hypothetical protein
MMIATMYYTECSGCSDPYVYTISSGYVDTDSNLTSNYCRCPNCGRWHEPCSQTLYIPAQPQEEFEDEDIREALRQWHKALSRQAAWEASVALRGEDRERKGKVPLQSQQRPYVRPMSKKRVCAGSSRYRVRVN